MDTPPSFAHPWILWCLPPLLLLLAAFLRWSWRRRQELTRRFVRSRLLASLTVGVSPRRHFLRMGLLVASALLLLVALARPQWGSRLEEARMKGIDIIIALDTSKSMLATDITPNRLERAKLAALDLLAQVGGDRLGLVAFAGTAFLQCPLTLDDEIFRQNVMSIDPGIIPQGGTALAQALEVALDAFDAANENFRAIVLITDGEDHQEGALEVARKAARANCRIFTVGVGTAEGELLRITDEEGRSAFLKDSRGDAVKSRLNEPLLREMAEIGSGFHIPLRDTDSIASLYRSGLAPLPRGELASGLFREAIDRFQWVVVPVMALLMIEPFVNARRRVHRPEGPIRSATVLQA